MEIPAKPDHVLTCEETQWMTSPLVYVRRRVHDGKALYVGATSYGLSRPLGNTHERAQLEEGEVLEVYLTKEPFKLECMMLKHEEPILNNGQEGKGLFNLECQYGGCGKSFQAKNGKAQYCSPSCRFKAWDQRYPRPLRTT